MPLAYALAVLHMGVWELEGGLALIKKGSSLLPSIHLTEPRTLLFRGGGKWWGAGREAGGQIRLLRILDPALSGMEQLPCASARLPHHTTPGGTLLVLFYVKPSLWGLCHLEALMQTSIPKGTPKGSWCYLRGLNPRLQGVHRH